MCPLLLQAIAFLRIFFVMSARLSARLSRRNSPASIMDMDITAGVAETRGSETDMWPELLLEGITAADLMWPDLDTSQCSRRVQCKALKTSEAAILEAESQWTPRVSHRSIPSALEKAASALTDQPPSSEANSWQRLKLSQVASKLLTQSGKRRSVIASTASAELASPVLPPAPEPATLVSADKHPHEQVPCRHEAASAPCSPPEIRLQDDPSPTPPCCEQCLDREYILVPSETGADSACDYEIVPLLCSCRGAVVHGLSLGA